MIDSKKVASLARIELNDSEVKALNEQFPSMLKYFEQLEEVNTDGVEPMVTPTEIQQNIRKDESVMWKASEEALSQAPEKSGQLYKVPPIVG